MKKIIIGLVLVAVTQHAAADALAVKVGVGGWAVEGNAGSGAGSDTETQLAGSIALEHPVPLLPNVKLRNWEFSSDSGPVLALHTFDTILYYEFFDNALFDLDLGVAATKYSNGEAQGRRFDGWMPQLYAALKVPVPVTGFAIYGEATGGSWDDSTTYDIEGGASYTVDMPVLDIDLRLGYRQVENDLGGFDRFDGELDFSGWTLGIVLDI